MQRTHAPLVQQETRRLGGVIEPLSCKRLVILIQPETRHRKTRSSRFEPGCRKWRRRGIRTSIQVLARIKGLANESFSQYPLIFKHLQAEAAAKSGFVSLIRQSLCSTLCSINAAPFQQYFSMDSERRGGMDCLFLTVRIFRPRPSCLAATRNPRARRLRRQC